MSNTELAPHLKVFTANKDFLQYLNQDYLYQEACYTNYFNELKANSVITQVEFIIDNSLSYYYEGASVIRGRLRIMYKGASAEFLNKYGIQLNKWYYIDKQVSSRDDVGYAFEHWQTVNFSINRELDLSGLMSD